ncbi:ImmA/IrrE family metallo-endopeptidase [Oceanobacillus sp. CF4.6]|uniref:ImmA/IrrE family metallo-endopeptidase n=1 Tax=Oceanobacillus sp. CF4.6 TaxID=3373080 RepID=UPI003EE6AA82
MATQREKKLAKLILKKYSLSPPIDIHTLIEKYAVYEEANLPNDVDAICIMNIERPLVILDRFKSENRKRFTLAHELGHLIIPWHQGMISCHTDQDDRVDGDSYHNMENEANSFASELLMPSDWLENIITNNDNKSLDEIIDIVSDNAQVSKSAAFFSLRNHLPSGYFFFINNKQLGFHSLKRSEGTNIVIPTVNNTYDINWLKSCSIDQGVLSFNSLDIYWLKLPQGLTDEQIDEIIKESDEIDINNIFTEIENRENGLFAATFQQLLLSLPTGFALAVIGEEYYRTYVSHDTKIRVPIFEKKRQVYEWFKDYSYRHGIFKYKDYVYIWGHFVVDTPKNTIQDVRVSTEIFNKILDDCYSNGKKEEKLKVRRSISGIIGALNNDAPDDFEEFYRKFKERFIGVERFKKVYEHPEFDVFVIKKIKELIKRKKS